MPRPVDWNDESSRFGVILRDMDTCNRLNGVVALSKRGQTILEIWVRDCTAEEKAGNFPAPIPNDTFTTGPHDAPTLPADLLDDVPSDGATGNPGSTQWVSKVIDNILAGIPGTPAFEAWKLARCYDAIAAHAAQRP